MEHKKTLAQDLRIEFNQEIGEMERTQSETGAELQNLLTHLESKRQT